MVHELLIKNYCQIIIKNNATKTKVRKDNFPVFKTIYKTDPLYSIFTFCSNQEA